MRATEKVTKIRYGVHYLEAASCGINDIQIKMKGGLWEIATREKRKENISHTEKCTLIHSDYRDQGNKGKLASLGGINCELREKNVKK